MYYEQKEKTECSCSSTQTGKENGHRHEWGESEDATYSAILQNREAYNRQGQAKEEELEKRI